MRPIIYIRLCLIIRGRGYCTCGVESRHVTVNYWQKTRSVLISGAAVISGFVSFVTGICPALRNALFCSAFTSQVLSLLCIDAAYLKRLPVVFWMELDNWVAENSAVQIYFGFILRQRAFKRPLGSWWPCVPCGWSILRVNVCWRCLCCFSEPDSFLLISHRLLTFLFPLLLFQYRLQVKFRQEKVIKQYSKWK